jgi:uncharacterized damage-inducible protein DinB
MTFSESLLPEFDKEMAATRKILAVVPEALFAWKPHEKSMTLGRLASHVAEMPSWADHVITLDRLVLDSSHKAFNAPTSSELLATFDANLTAGRAALLTSTDEHLAKIWELTYNGHILMSMPRTELLRSVVMNHMIHHRGQLSVYLRLNGVPVPGMYGPSADEKGM